jgi:hypothetical protein
MADMLGILLPLALLATPADGVVVERIVAVVRNPAGAAPRPVTLTRLVEEARLALVARGALEAAAAPLDPPALRAALRWLVDQQLVADEATRLGVGEVAREDVAAELQRLRERFPGPEAWAGFLQASGLTEEEIEPALARGLRVRRYLDSRVGRATRVGDDEVARSLAEQGVSPDAPGARQAARARLASARASALAEQLVADLRARADVRVLVPELREGAAQ